MAISHQFLQDKNQDTKNKIKEILIDKNQKQ
jgi:hypothetical protein